jgi:hypothetical protein
MSFGKARRNKQKINENRADEKIHPLGHLIAHGFLKFHFRNKLKQLELDPL